MTTPTVTKSVVKAASLVQAMHSVYYESQGKTATFQPEGVELKEGEATIKGLTFVTA